MWSGSVFGSMKKKELTVVYGVDGDADRKWMVVRCGGLVLKPKQVFVVNRHLLCLTATAAWPIAG